MMINQSVQRPVLFFLSFSLLPSPTQVVVSCYFPTGSLVDAGKMGLLRNLTASEIIAQVLLGKALARQAGLPPLTNVVLMGMGDAGGNIAAVGPAVCGCATH